MHRTGAFKTFPGDDNDISSVAPSVLPNNMLFQIGKQQTGFLVDTNSMTQLQSLHMCNGVEAFGTNAFDGSHVFVPCSSHIQEINVDVAHRSMSLGLGRTRRSAPRDRRSSRAAACGRSTGLPARCTCSTPRPARYARRSPSDPWRTSPRPSAALGLVLVPTLSGVTAFAGPSGVPPHVPGVVCRAEVAQRILGRGSRRQHLPVRRRLRAAARSSGVHLVQPIVGMAGRTTPGYWLVASDGGVFAFGDAHFHGSMGGTAPEPAHRRHGADTVGQRLLARRVRRRDLRFGDARLPRLDRRHAPEPARSSAWRPTPYGQRLLARRVRRRHLRVRRRALPRLDGRHAPEPADRGHGADAVGQRLLVVAADGGVFTFGDAPFHGSTGSIRLVSPIVGIEGQNAGYRFVAGDGGVFAFNLPFAGSAAGSDHRGTGGRDGTRLTRLNGTRRLWVLPTTWPPARTRRFPARAIPGPRSTTAPSATRLNACRRPTPGVPPPWPTPIRAERSAGRGRSRGDRPTTRACGCRRCRSGRACRARRRRRPGTPGAADRVAEIGPPVQVVLGVRREHETRPPSVRGLRRGFDPRRAAVAVS